MLQSSHWILAVGLLGLAGGSSDLPNLEDPIAVTGGLVEGTLVEGTSVRAYKGIPFAAPPVGELRWQPPQQVIPWEGVLDASVFSDACTQYLPRSRPPWTEAFMHQGAASEDCLYLNVWTVAERAEEKRPVMVWIYGGGFQEGSTAVATYDGIEFARRGVVMVSMNYRLGLLGFMAHPELSKESPHGSSGNYGFHDQIAALKWVRENIAAFGGDPNNVTVFGQSAGAMSIRILMESPLAKGFFVRGIMQSGAESMPPSFANSATTLAQAERAGLSIQDQLGVDSLSELRQLPGDKFLIQSPLGLAKLEDGWLLPAGGTETRPLPVVVGMVANDWMWGIDPTETAEDYIADVKQAYGDQASKYLELYQAEVDSQVTSARQIAIRDRGRVALTLWADRHSEKSESVFTYFFDRAIPWPEMPQFGAFHSGELPYVFNTLDALDRPWEHSDSILADQLISYWVNFARVGDPNGDGLPSWESHARAPRRVMRLGSSSGMIPASKDDQVELWREIFDIATQ